VVTLESNCSSPDGTIENLSQNDRDLLSFRTTSSYSRIPWSYRTEHLNILHGQQIIHFIKIMHISYGAYNFFLLNYLMSFKTSEYLTHRITASQTFSTCFNEPVTFCGWTSSCYKFLSQNPKIFVNETSLVFLTFFTESLVSPITDSLNITYVIRNNITSFLTNLLNFRQSTLDIVYKTRSSPGIHHVKFAPPLQIVNEQSMSKKRIGKHLYSEVVAV